MTGRGIDQVLPRPCDPALHESYADSATDYVRLAEAAHGPIPRTVDPSYIWGAAINEFDRMRPDVRIINLETSITRSEDYADKGINYRMSPENADCLKAAAIDCCSLANNHVLDWGYRGLRETLATLKRLEIKTTGAGGNLSEASAPAAIEIPGKGRLLLFSFACVTSGTPRIWGAGPDRPGVNLLENLSAANALRVAHDIAAITQPGDLIVVSLHWGSNWGYEIPDAQQSFAHDLIDRAGVSIIHGHSSHHAKAVEVYRNRLILYGCGDFINDYEGIKGYEEFRDDLVLMYFADVLPAGTLWTLEIVPLQIRNFHLVCPSEQDTHWIQQVLDRESRKFGTSVTLNPNGQLVASWTGAA
jgi:poly-gamma-glutamate capsule biosynthesis protein CapA/YwtB (metallophosphatase superfamily)